MKLKEAFRRSRSRSKSTERFGIFGLSGEDKALIAESWRGLPNTKLFCQALLKRLSDEASLSALFPFAECASAARARRLFVCHAANLAAFIDALVRWLEAGEEAAALARVRACGQRHRALVEGVQLEPSHWALAHSVFLTQIGLEAELRHWPSWDRLLSGLIAEMRA